MNKFQVVQWFGTLELFGEPYDELVLEEITNYGFYEQKYSWNEIDCSMDFYKANYPTLTTHQVKEIIASAILEKIGKSIEIQLVCN